ncbi:MAG: FAD-dependent oxidoreductase [Planctomycetota bacterium]
MPDKASDHRVAVVGAGPSGLACAAALLEAGHGVTIFDRSGLGGLIDSTIPPDRVRGSLAEEIAATFADVPKDRLEVRADELSTGRDLDTLLGKEFDAAFVGLGLSQAVGIADEKPEGVLDALKFLRDAKSGSAEVAGRRVAVIGGGNTAIDAALTASRLGARDVSLIYRRSFNEMPAWPAERDEAVAAGVHIRILTQPLGYESADGRVTAVTVCPTELGEPDDSSRRRPVPQEDSAYALAAELVIEAIGQQAPAELASWLPSVDVANGLIRVDDNLQTSREGVFAGGDVIRGPDTVVAAIADGMKAARQIDRRLTSGKIGAKP